jgi:hypothetical protein
MYPLAIIGDQLMVQRWIHSRKSDKLRGAARSGIKSLPQAYFMDSMVRN